MRVNKTVLLNGREFFLKLIEVWIRLINREGSQRRWDPDIAIPTNELQNARRFSGSVERVWCMKKPDLMGLEGERF